jgi:hypothetical protein
VAVHQQLVDDIAAAALAASMICHVPVAATRLHSLVHHAIAACASPGAE